MPTLNSLLADYPQPFAVVASSLFFLPQLWNRTWWTSKRTRHIFFDSRILDFAPFLILLSLSCFLPFDLSSETSRLQKGVVPIVPKMFSRAQTTLKTPNQRKKANKQNTKSRSFVSSALYICSKIGVPPLDAQSPKLHRNVVKKERGTSSRPDVTARFQLPMV